MDAPRPTTYTDPRATEGGESAGPRALLIACHSGAQGGAQAMAVATAERFQDRCSIFAAVADGPVGDRFAECAEVIGPAPVLPIWKTSPWRWGLQFARSLLDAVRLAKEIRQNQIDAVVTTSTVLLSPVLAARLAGVPSIAYAREWPTTRAGTTVFWLQRHLGKVVVAISDGVASRFAATGRARVVQIADGVAIPPGEHPPARLRRPLRLCVIGSLTGGDAKGQHRAVETLAELGDLGVEATLSVVGPILDREYLERVEAVVQRCGVVDRVEITGPEKDVPGLLREHDVLLFCSSQGADVTPLVLMEALIEERPVVAADVGSVREVVADDCGEVVPPEDPSAMAAAVARIAADPEAARERTARGNLHVRRQFDRRVTLDRLWAEIVAETGNRDGAQAGTKFTRLSDTRETEISISRPR
jgi:glycosyltransferase involved in cell wall biosynthesis